MFFSIQQFNFRSGLFSWIYRIAVNQCYGVLRKRRLHARLQYGLGPKTEQQGTDRQGTWQDRAIEMKDARPLADHELVQKDFVNHLLALISERDRTLLILKEVEGLSVAELAAETRLNENTIKIRLFRARRTMLQAAARLSRC